MAKLQQVSGLRALEQAPRSALSALANINANRFDDAALKANVDESTYAAFHASVTDGSTLPKPAAKDLANSLMKWATDRGAVNYAHWFFPMRGMKAGVKQDAFISLDFGHENPLKPITTGFSGSAMSMGETDGSSFPNGGLRATHTAAAYLNWDRSSPPFVRGDTLYFPSSFTSWKGEALDYKTPLLRSQRAVNVAATKLLHQMGRTEVSEVHANVGWEQEYFIIPAELYNARPDLVNTKRTVFGAMNPLNQQLSDQYFTTMQPRVKAFTEELQAAMWEGGMATSVYHNEVAPSQHEFSPIFALTNVAADQNIQSVEIMETVAADHGLAVLFHEKPFADVNGSGKHCNWGLNTDTGLNLYDPGNVQAEFVAMTAALIHGVHQYPALIRTAVASHGNDFRLGGHEAPPAIFSIATGVELEAHLRAIIGGGELDGYGGIRYGGKMIDAGAPELAPIGASLEDRNRTAPIPFCGNRFELRAVGSNQNISMSCTVMNTIAAEGCAAISALIDDGASPRDAVAQILEQNMNIVFNGDGYSSEWHEAAVSERGLPNYQTTIDAFDAFTDDKNVDVFSKHGVYGKDEVFAVASIGYERYALDMQIEAETMLMMVNQGVLPAAAADLKAYDGTNLAGSRAAVYGGLADATAALQAVVDAIPDADEKTMANYALDVVKPAMDATRAAQDASELLIDSAKYPFPTYHEMLFAHHMDGRV